jgi:hypothetical protein
MDIDKPEITGIAIKRIMAAASHLIDVYASLPLNLPDYTITPTTRRSEGCFPSILISRARASLLAYRPLGGTISGTKLQSVMEGVVS